MEIISIILSYLGILLWIFGLYLAFFSHLRGMFGRAIVVVWHKKYLLFMAFFGGLTAYGGEVNFLFQRFNTVTTLEAFLEGLRVSILNGTVDQLWRSSKNLWLSNLGSISSSIVIIVLLTAVITWLIIMSQAAIIRIIGRSQQSKPTGLVDGLASGVDKFWTLLQLNIIGLLTGWALWVILTAVPAAIFLIVQNTSWSIVAYFGSLLAIMSSIVTIFLVQFATAGIVLRDAKLVPAIVDAWHLFTRNTVSSLETAIAIFTANVTVSFLIIAQLVFFFTAYTVSGFLTIVSIIVILYAFLSAFSFSAWTIYYLKLVEGQTPSKLGQWTNRLANFAGQKRAVD